MGNFLRGYFRRLLSILPIIVPLFVIVGIFYLGLVYLGLDSLLMIVLLQVLIAFILLALSVYAAYKVGYSNGSREARELGLKQKVGDLKKKEG